MANNIFVNGTGISGVDIQDEGVSTVGAADALNFVGAGVTVTDAGGDEATITIPGGAGISGTTYWWNLAVVNGSEFVLDDEVKKIAFTVPEAGDIKEVRLKADVSGSVTVDILKTTYAAYDPPTHPATGDSIQQTAISGAKKATTTGLTVAVAEGDEIGIEISGSATITLLAISVKIERG